MIHKFRAWDSFCNGYAMNKIDSVISRAGDYYKYVFDRGTRYVMEQFTTNHDINKKEIYQGDIVRLAFDEIDSPIPEGFTGEVRFMQGSFQVVNDDLQLSFPVWQEIAQWEIIGNIHEGVKDEV